MEEERIFLEVKPRNDEEMKVFFQIILQILKENNMEIGTLEPPSEK